MEIKQSARMLAKLVAVALLLALSLTLLSFQVLQMLGKVPKAGVPVGVLDTLKWAALAALALASMSFGFYRTLDAPGDRPLMKVVRAAGARFVVAAVFYLVTLGVGVAGSTFGRVPGAATNPPLDQVVLPAVILVIFFVAAGYTVLALRGLLEVALSTIPEDDPRLLSDRVSAQEPSRD